MKYFVTVQQVYEVKAEGYYDSMQQVEAHFASDKDHLSTITTNIAKTGKLPSIVEITAKKVVSSRLQV